MIIVYITDTRPQYPPSILVTTGLPTGSHTEYRYATKWLSPGLLDRWSRNGLADTEVLVCFLEGNKDALQNAKALPVRMARIVKTELHGTFATMRVQLGKFPTNLHLHELTHLCGTDNIVAPGPRQKLYVLETAPMQMPLTGNEEVSLWQDVVYELSLMSTFTDASFAFFEGAVPEGVVPAAVSPTVVRPNAGTLVLRPDFSYELILHLYARSSSAREHSYLMHIDENLVQQVEAGSLRLKSRFTSFRLLVRTCRTLRKELTVVKIAVEDGHLGTDLVVRTQISATLFGHAKTLAVPSLSAGLATSAGVAGTALPLWIKVIMVAVGSVGLAIGSRR